MSGDICPSSASASRSMRQVPYSRRGYRLASPRARSIAFAAFFVWGIVVTIGIRLPYLHTALSAHIREYVLFPALFVAIAYFGFIYKGNRRSSGYMEAVTSLPTRSARIKYTVGVLGGLMLISAGVPWTSIAFPASLTAVFARKPIHKCYRVTDVYAWGGSTFTRMFDLTLHSTDSEDDVVVPLRGSTYDRIRSRTGDFVCAEGRRWALGTVIDRVSRP